MKKNVELVKNTIIILLGKICTQFLSFFMLPLYTNYLKTSEYGLFDLITTYVILFTPVISLQLESSIFRMLIDSRKNEKQKKLIISNGVLMIFKSSIIIGILYIIISIIFNVKYKYYLLLIVLFTLVINTLLQIARGLGKTINYAVSSIVVGITNILLSIVLIVFFKMGLKGLFIANIISNFLGCIYLFLHLKIYSYISFKNNDSKISKEMLNYSLPLLPNGIMWWVINVSDRTIITLFLGTAVNGIYAVANKFSTLFVSLYNVFNLSWQEQATLYIDDKENESFYSETFNNMLKIFSSIGVMILVCLPILFNLLVGKEYASAYKYIPILIIASIFNIIVAFLGSIYLALKKTKEVAKTSLFSAIINFVINIIFVKYIGVYAAALSTFMAFFIMTIYRYYDIKKIIKIKLDTSLVLEITLLYIITILIYYINNMFIDIISFVLISLLILYLNYSYIEIIIKKLKSKVWAKK